MELEAAKNTKEEGLRLYFALVAKGYVSAQDDWGRNYINNSEIRNFIHACAKASGTEVLDGGKYIHLVVSDTGSLFSTPYSQLKESLGNENQEQFHLLSLIALVYLSEVDGSLSLMNRADVEGISYVRLSNITERVIKEWLERIEEDQNFEKTWDMNVRESMETFLSKNLKDEQVSRLMPSFRTKIGIVHKLMSFMEKQGLVKIYKVSKGHIVYPTEVLNERIQLAYRDDTRYNALKELIENSKEGQ